MAERRNTELERVPTKRLKPTDVCPICVKPFLDGQYIHLSALSLSLPLHPFPPFPLSFSISYCCHKTLLLCPLPSYPSFSRKKKEGKKTGEEKPERTQRKLRTLTLSKDPYPLIVRLPCHPSHLYDLECITPWLKLHTTCPLDRKELLQGKWARDKEAKRRLEQEKRDDGDEEEDEMGMYG